MHNINFLIFKLIGGADIPFQAGSNFRLLMIPLDVEGAFSSAKALPTNDREKNCSLIISHKFRCMRSN